MPTSLVDLLVTCDCVLVGEEELGGERRWRKLNIELNDLTDCDDEYSNVPATSQWATPSWTVY